MTLLLSLILFQSATGSPTPSPAPLSAPASSTLSDLDGLSADGRAIVDRSMASWRPLAAAARAAAAQADRDVIAATGADPLDLDRLAAALVARDEGQAAWRRQRTELGLQMVRALAPADQAIAARLIAGVVAQPVGAAAR